MQQILIKFYLFNHYDYKMEAYMYAAAAAVWWEISPLPLYSLQFFIWSFYIYRLCLALENLAWEYFWLHSEKQDGRQSSFSTFFLTFSLSSYSGCVIGRVFNFLGEINCYKRLP